MKKLFLSTSFSTQVDPATGAVFPDFKKQIELIIKALENAELKVFCAVREEGWIISNKDPEISIKEDLKEIDQADVVLAILHDSISAGVQFEMGYAVGKGKKVFAATTNDEKLKYFNIGAAKAGKITHLLYDDPKLLAQEIKNRAYN